MTTLPVHGPRRWVGLLGFGLAVFLAAAVGAWGAVGAAQDYQALDRPGWAPPSWLFGPVWTVLYVVIAIAGWLIWQRSGWSPAMAVFSVQLVLNALWSPLFFGAGAYTLALLDIILLWFAIVATMALSGRVSRTASWLLGVYLAWVTFAAILNAVIWHLN